MGAISSNLIILLLTFTLFMVMLGVLVSIYFRNRETKYDEKLHRIELEMFRKSIENRVGELNDKLTSTEARWKDVNHLLISNQDAYSKHPDRKSIFDKFEIREMNVDPKLVFVLTPFNNNYTKTYEVIVSSCLKMGLKAARGDEEFVRGEVFPRILELIQRASIIVANINGRNPNVFYELGIAHALGKQTILVSKGSADVPFDIRTNRVVIYANDHELSGRLQTELGRALVEKSSNS